MEVTVDSMYLSRKMSFRVYGNGGCPVLVFPTQEGMCAQWEDFGMIDVLGSFISEGRIQIFCVDTVDVESWSAKGADNQRRAARQEEYFNFIVEELLPHIHRINGSGMMPMTAGCSLGATHAVNMLLRRPDLFCGVLAMSGAYDARYFTDGCMNDLWHDNSPVDFLRDLPQDDWRVEMCRHRTIAICLGQGDYEEPGLESTGPLQKALEDKGIDAWVDWWGKDVSHDWVWWKRQVVYFLPYVLDEIYSRAAGNALA